MSYEQILVDRQDGLAVVTLNRPDKLNAWTRQMNRELIAAISQANDDPEVGAIVLTGAGRGFCAGADVEQAFHRRKEGDDEAEERTADWVELVRSSKPLVAAINGVAVGVGITMVLPFDILLASTAAKIGMFFVRMGLVPELGSSQLLVQRVGFAKASEMCLTGKLYEAAELEGTGLLNGIVDPESLMDEALSMANTIAANPPSSLRAIKKLLTENGSETDLAAVQRRELAALAKAYETPDHKEAVSAFLEKRAPRFGATR